MHITVNPEKFKNLVKHINQNSAFFSADPMLMINYDKENNTNVFNVTHLKNNVFNLNDQKFYHIKNKERDFSKYLQLFKAMEKDTLGVGVAMINFSSDEYCELMNIFDFINILLSAIGHIDPDILEEIGVNIKEE